MEEFYHALDLILLVKWFARFNFTSSCWIYIKKFWMNLGCFNLVIKFTKKNGIVIYRSDR